MNSFGKLFKITLYGESHQRAIGVVIDGILPGILIDIDKIYNDIELRKPKGLETTLRKEEDKMEITSGIFNGKTTGSPIHITFENKNVISKDYEHLVNHPRPNHADYIAGIKYNHHHDYRGGGRFSGRLTLPIVAAGSIAKQMMPFKFSHEIIQVGSLTDLSKIDSYLKEIKDQGDTIGGIIKVSIKDVLVGLGEPMFEKLDAKLSQALFSIPTVKGVIFGRNLSKNPLFGSEYNDVIIDNKGTTKTNNSGGIVGGISNGNDIEIEIHLKPISSILQKQQSFNIKENKIKDLEIKGRHDVSIINRVGIVLENMAAIVMADMYLEFKARK